MVARLLESTVEFPYTRSLGPIVGRYVAALGQRRLTGSRAGGRVLVPPLEYDPATGDEASPDLVEVGPGGTVRSWTWVPTPSRAHPLDHPFAFALIQLDGADTAMVHAVDAGDSAVMSTGMRVVPRWADEPRGHLDDLACFVPADADEPVAADGASAASTTALADLEPVGVIEIPSSLRYTDVLSAAAERYGATLVGGTIMGQKCPQCGLVYVPPRDFCPIDAIRLDESNDLPLADKGVVTNFTVVTPVAYPGQKETEPFVRMSVLLDNADALLGLQALVEAPNDAVRVGLRVEAVWLPPEERNLDALTNRGWGAVDAAIRGWRPTGEPDLPAEDYIERVF